MGSVAEMIQKALDEGLCSRDEIRGFFESNEASSKSVYRTLVTEVNHWGHLARLSLDSDQEENEVFVPWNSELKRLFAKVDESGPEFRTLLEGVRAAGIEGPTLTRIEVKALRYLPDCVARVAATSCTQSPLVERFDLEASFNLHLGEVKWFDFSAEIAHGKPSRLLFGKASFEPKHALNIFLLELFSVSSFLLFPIFFNASDSGDGRLHRIVKVVSKDEEISYADEIRRWQRTPHPAHSMGRR